MHHRREFLGIVGATAVLVKGANSLAVSASISKNKADGKLRVALMQASPAGSDQQRNLEIAERYCRLAAERGADVLVMPEMWNIGYQGVDDLSTTNVRRWQDQAIDSDGAWVSRFRELARELGLAIAVTYLQRWPSKPRNTVSLIDRHGDMVLTYAKVHTCDFAFEAALTPGENWSAVDLDTAKGEVRVGAMICFDREFPESMRSLMLAGAEVVLTPNACLLDDLRLAQFRVRAYENATAVAIANYPSPMHNGHSTAYDAAGTSLVDPNQQEGLLTAAIDLPALRSYRQSTIWGNAWRRPHRYSALTESVDLEVFRRKDAYGQPFDPRQR